MSNFDSNKHPRGQGAKFVDKQNSQPETPLPAPDQKADATAQAIARSPEQIADAIMERDYTGARGAHDVRVMLADAAREAQQETSSYASHQLGYNRGYREAQEESEPQFAPEGEPDQYRDLWNENMPRLSERMWFAMPGEQPIHVSDDQAHHILAYLSEQNR